MSRTTYILNHVLLCGVFGFCASAIAQSGPRANPDWDAVVVAAKKEGKVALYSSSPPPANLRALEGFKKAYPEIAAELVRGPSGQLLSKVEQERATNSDGADVFVSTELGWFLERAKEGRLMKPAGPASEGWPSRYLYAGSAVIIEILPFVISYNKNLVSTPPKTYADLLRPEYRNKLGTTDLASTSLVAWYDWLEKTQGADFLPKLRSQNPKLYTGAVPLGQANASGEIAVSAFGVPSVVKPLMEKGAPIDFVMPNPVLGVLTVGGALGWSKRPNAALVLLDYLTSIEGQTRWHSDSTSASPLPNIPHALATSGITPMDTTAYPADVAQKYREKWNKIFKN